MNKRHMLAIGLVAALATAQLIRPGYTNPASDPADSLAAQAGPARALAAVLDRSCNECHSNLTTWPSYTKVAPLSWVAASAVKEGRRVLNFSEWTNYSPAQQRQLLEASCAAASSGKMPGSFYTSLEPRARLSAEDVRTICQASNEVAVGQSQ